MQLLKANLISLVFASVGILIGLQIYTFQFAEGFSYFSSDPRACINCHIMQSQYDSWLKSGHKHAAACNDCHMPEGLVAKLMAKASNGYHHSKGFTLQDFPEPILIKESNSRILQASCVRCHDQVTHMVQANTAVYPGAEMRCVKCHADVGHGNTPGMGRVAD
ncbi:MAG: cytochrome c nitrite reductase small subunit [Leptospiraceae bacterium]|nr:cytochrome c nitrite reductase small subunit [Leptospiraceae bacterium]